MARDCGEITGLFVCLHSWRFLDYQFTLYNYTLLSVINVVTTFSRRHSLALNMPTAPSTPPKRMTRARAAKAADNTDTTTKTPTTKIMTPAAKAAATRKTKRAAPPVDDEEDELLAEAAANRTKNANATVTTTDNETTTKSVPKRRGRADSKTQASASVVEEVQEPAVSKRGRGRPRKATVAEDATEEPEPATGRALRTKQNALAPAVAAPPRRPVNNKKKVSFQEQQEDEKENAPLPTKKALATTEGASTKETGIRAKPTRRPAAARTTAKAKATPVVAQAVSPVKNLQTDSVSSRDELDDMGEDEEEAPSSPKKAEVEAVSSPEKSKTSSGISKPPTPFKPMAVSPIKDIPAPAALAMSPKKGLASSLLGSPARRPPQSPQKSTLKDSPHKPSVGSTGLGQSSVSTPAKESMLSKSPKKFTLSTVERKPSVLTAPSSNFKRSLFASPPKRPFSPYKTMAPPSTIKNGLSLMSAMTAVSHRPSPLVPTITPARTMVASSAFSMQKSPAASAKVHKMTLEEREEMMKLELESAPSPFTPWANRPAKTPKDQRILYRNELKNAPAPFTPNAGRPQFSRVTSTGSVSGSSRKPSQVVHVENEMTPEALATPADNRALFERSTTPEGFPAEVLKRMSTPSYGNDYRTMDFDSDDELQLSDSTAKLTITPKRVFEQTPTTQAPKTPSSYSRATFSSQNKAGPMTALANKFGDWKSATPDTKVLEHRKQERALFSIAKPSKRSVPVTPVAARLVETPRTQQQNKGEMTALAQKFGDWRGASPDKKEKSVQKSLFSPVKPSNTHAPRTPAIVHSKTTPKTVRAPMTVMADKFRVAQASPGVDYRMQSPEKQSYFDEAMEIMEDADDMDIDSRPTRHSLFGISQTSVASREYADENVSPVDEDDLMLDISEVQAAAEPVSIRSPLPAVITPARLHDKQPRVVHTVTKVPLKPSADYGKSPSIRPAKRSHSLSGPVSPQSMKDNRALREIPFRFESSPVVKSNVPIIEMPETPEQKHTLRTPSLAAAAPTPIRTPRSDLNTRLLAGAVVYVDVHTTEGADASGIFVELLNAMGAKCVKQWSWNPDASVAGDANAMEAADENRRVGITHVVFKDGGKRTMEKVRAAGGLVSCIGVAWVLE